jgi:hypothetical protein
MSFTEKFLKCINCKKDFTFTVEEQEFRSFRGFPNEPERCAPCRKARKPSSSLIENSTRTNVVSDRYFR